MKRDFLEGLGLEKETIDKILDENSKDIGKEKAKAEQFKEDLENARNTLADREKDLEELRKSTGDAAEIQKQLDELQFKYETETNDYKNQLAERDYTGAMSRMIADHAVKFSSKAAERAFLADLKEKKLEMKDGALSGFEDFLKEQKEADPTAFAADDRKPNFSKPTGGAGGKPGNPESKGESLAKSIGGAKAKSAEATKTVISQYTGGGKS